MTLASYLFSAWRLVESGTKMADVFAGRFKALGGKIITGRSVHHIQVSDGRVSDVRLDDGKIIPTSGVVATVHPKVLIDMLDEHATKPSYRNRIRQLKDTPGFFCVHARVAAKHHEEIPHNLFYLDWGKTGAKKNSMFVQLRKTTRPEWNLLTLIGDGRSPMWSPWENTITGRRGDPYLEKKRQEADKMIARAGKEIGPFKSAKLLDTYTPLTIRDWVNSPDGSAYGAMKSSDQFLSTALLNRTKIKGLNRPAKA